MRATEPEARRQFAATQERAIGNAAVEVRTRFVELDTGLHLQLLEVGDGDPLVMLHGTGAFGHVSCFGHPERSAELISRFLDEDKP